MNKHYSTISISRNNSNGFKYIPNIISKKQDKEINEHFFDVLCGIKSLWSVDPIYIFYILRKTEEIFYNNIKFIDNTIIARIIKDTLLDIKVDKLILNIKNNLNIITESQKIFALSKSVLNFNMLNGSNVYHEQIFTKIKELHLNGITSLVGVNTQIYKMFLQDFCEQQQNSSIKKTINLAIKQLDNVMYALYALGNNSINELSSFISYKLKSEDMVALPYVDILKTEKDFQDFLGHVKIILIKNKSYDNLTEFNYIENLSSAKFYNRVHTINNLSANILEIVNMLYIGQLTPKEFNNIKTPSSFNLKNSNKKDNHQITSQVIGNCTEKSIRILLIELLGESLFTSFADYIDIILLKYYPAFNINKIDAEILQILTSIELCTDYLDLESHYYIALQEAKDRHLNKISTSSANIDFLQNNSLNHLKAFFT